jgi:hypothetical protein
MNVVWPMKNLICLILLVNYVGYTKAQVKKLKDTESIYKREVTFISGPCYGTIINENSKNDPYADSKKTFTPKFGMTYFIPTDKLVGYTVGLEYNRFVGITSYKGYFRGSTLLKDVNGGGYYPLIEADYTSEVRVNTLSIPLAVRFRKEILKNVEFIINGGINLNVILSYRNYLNGVYNKKGLYPATGGNVPGYFLVENEPQLGYTNTTYTNVRKNIESQPLAFSAMLGGGFKINTSEKLFVTVDVNYLYGISDINGSNYKPTYINVFGEKSTYKKNTLNQWSLSIGMGFRISEGQH